MSNAIIKYIEIHNSGKRFKITVTETNNRDGIISEISNDYYARSTQIIKTGNLIEVGNNFLSCLGKMILIKSIDKVLISDNLDCILLELTVDILS